MGKDKNVTIQDVYKRKAYTGRCAKRLDESEIGCDLTFIIPLFNAQKYMKFCLDSVLHQKTNYQYEVILIDDGSTDNTLSIAKEYENRFKEIKVIRQRNMGPAGARNTGLQAARGRYIAFVDSDDYITHNYVQRLLDQAYEANADIVKFGHFEVREKYVQRHTYDAVYAKDRSEIDIMEYRGYIWEGIVHRKIWEQICFPEGYWYEDMVSRFLVFQCAKCFACVNDAFYYHRYHQTNISNILLGSSSYQCLDQLFLPLELKGYGDKLGIMNHEALGKILVVEWGELLYIRTRRLPIKLRKEVFRLAAYHIHAYEVKGTFNFKEKLFLWVFKKRFFYAWVMINVLICCNKVIKGIRKSLIYF